MASRNIVEHATAGLTKSAPLGTAQWMPADEALEKFVFDDSLFTLNDDKLWEGRSNGQIWVGETFDRESSPIGYRDDRHVLLVSGTRGGKGTGVIIPNLCLWPGSAIVIDPKGENATVTARRRGEGSEYTYGLKQTVRILDPFGEVPLDPSLKARYNPLDAIDPKSDFAVDDAGRIAAALVVVENRNDPFWEQAARNLIKALILHVLTARNFDGRRNLVSVWRLLRQGDWITVERARRASQEKIPSGFTLLWHGMKRNEAYSGLIAGEAEQMLDMHERTRSGILKVATTATEFIDGPPMQRLLETSDFDLAAIKTDPKGLTLYLTLPQRYMSTHFRWLRLMISLAVGEMEQIKGRPATGHPTLFLLDEFAGLQRMEAVENAAAQAAGFGVKFFFVLQNLPQLKEIYNDSWETFLGNSGLRLFFQVDDNFTRSYLAQQLGEREVVRETQSSSRSDSTSASTTDGRSGSKTTGNSSSITDGQNAGGSLTRTTGTSVGDSTTYRGLLGFWPQTRNYQGGANRSRATSRSHGWSTSKSASRSESISDSLSFSRSESSSRSITEGWAETIHKRLLLNPDEIGRFLARIDNSQHAAYPGVVLALMPGEQPLAAHRINYFEAAGFEGFFDPHPGHPPPPTLAERIRRLADLQRQPEAPPVPPQRRPLATYAGLIGAAILIIAVAVWLLSPSDPRRPQAAVTPQAVTPPQATTPPQAVTPPQAAMPPQAVTPPQAAMPPQAGTPPPTVIPPQAAVQPPPAPEITVAAVESAADQAYDKRDYSEAMRLYRQAADRGSAHAQNEIGTFYGNGEGVTQDYVEALRWFRKSADQGYPMAQSNIGWAYEQGSGVAVDFTEALRWYRMAADQGFADAQTKIGALYENAKGVPRDYAEALRWYRMAADRGFADAQAGIGALYANGEGVARDYAEALRWYRMAADQGLADAQVQVGRFYATGDGVTRDYAEALRWFHKAADQGQADAQTEIGVLYTNGDGVTQDYAEALRWFHKAADQGQADAQSDIGRSYEAGWGGGAQDFGEALHWYRKAADQGLAEAQTRIGALYLNGKGVSRDYAEAMRWYRMAADQGFAEAQNQVGLLYSDGDGVTRDYTAALRWFRKAADQSDPVAQANIGRFYEKGLGVPRDSVQAMRWYRMAADQGLADAQNEVGAFYANGDGVGRDYAEALRWFHKAADQDQTTAQANLGRFYERGWGVPRSMSEARKWMSKAAANGNESAKQWLVDHKQ